VTPRHSISTHWKSELHLRHGVWKRGPEFYFAAGWVKLDPEGKVHSWGWRSSVCSFDILKCSVINPRGERTGEHPSWVSTFTRRGRSSALGAKSCWKNWPKRPVLT
jgi:hypothetical protein